jgi:hypothetical protein
MLGGCATPEAYQAYATSMQEIARANANAQAAQHTAIMSLASSGDSTTKTVAVLMLALGIGNKQQVIVEPPKNEALQWAQVLLPSLTAVGLGYFGFRLGQTQSDNAAAVSIAGYGAMNGIADSGFNAVGKFKPVPFDWSGLAALQPNVTTTTTSTNTLTNQGNGVIGDGTVDNRVTQPPAVVAP